MSKDIWHTPPEQPDPFKSWNVLVVYEANDRKEMMYSTQFIHATDGMYVNRWCYLDDLLALETENKDLSDKIGKLETGIEKTRKALDVAVKAMESAKYFRLEHCMCCGHDPQKDAVYIKLKKALDKITALEQKDVK